jgi:putative ABC transport system permease protein
MFSVTYALRNLSRRKMRTAMGVLGVFCTLALLSAVQIGLDAISLSYVDLVSLAAGKADVVVTADDDGAWFASDGFDPGPVMPKLGAPLKGVAPRVLGIASVSAGSKSAFAVVVGLDAEREKAAGVDALTPWPELSPKIGAMSKELEERLGHPKKFEVADARGAGRAELVAANAVERQLVFPQPVREYVVVDLATAQDLFGMKGSVHQLAGALQDPRAYYDARDLHASVARLKDAGEAMASSLGKEYRVTLPKAAAIAAFQQFSAPVRAFFGIFAMAALAITALLVHSIVSVSEEERVREHAILRTVGAKRRSIFGLVLAESALMCTLGVVPGVFAGLVVAKGMLWLVSLAMQGQGTITVELSRGTMLLCLAAGVTVSVASALLPALRSTRRRIAPALDPSRRGEIDEPPAGERAFSRGLLAAGAALSAISAVVFFVLPTAFLSGDASMIGAVVMGLLVLLLAGFTMVGMALQPLAERALLGVMGWMFGPSADLAGRNLARQRRRGTSTSLMFALSVCFVLFLSSLVALFNRTFGAFLELQTGADVRVEVRGPAKGAAEAIAKTAGVRATSEVRHLRGRTEEGVAFDVVARDVVGMRQLWVVPFGVDEKFETASYAERAAFAEGDRSALADLQKESDEPAAILSLAGARYLGVSKGDLIELWFQLGAERTIGRFRVAAVAESMPGFRNFRGREAAAHGSGVLIGRKAWEAMTASAPAAAVEAFHFAKGEASAAPRLRESMGLRFQASVECTEEERKHGEVLYWATQVLFALLLCVAVTIAVFGLVASTASGVAERRREIAVLKAVGLKKRDLRRMFAAEAVALTSGAGVVGAAIGWLLAVMFVMQAAALIEMPVVFAVPWLTMATTLGISVVAGLAAAFIATKGLLHKPVAEILRG